MLRIWTMTLSQWRLAREAGIEVFNITAASGHQCFAPDMSMVKRYKDGEVGPTEYSEKYLGKMRRTFVSHRPEWDELKTKTNVAYACYCPMGTFCHRVLFMEMLKNWFQKAGIEFQYMGELTRDNPNYARIATN